MAFRIDTSGFNELFAQLEAAGANLAAASREAVRAGAEPIIEEAKATVGVKTGNLRESIKVKSVTQSGNAATANIVADAPHAHLVEHGHGGPHPAPPHPFLEPAFISRMDEAQERIADVMRGALGQ